MASTEGRCGPIAYTVEGRRRRTVAIQVSRDGRVRVLAPRRMPRGAIDAFVRGRRFWIEAKLAEFARLPRVEPIGLAEGAALPYLGSTVTLTLVSGRGEVTLTEEGTLRVALRCDAGSSAVHRRINGWYLGECRRLCIEIASELAPRARELGIPALRGVESRRMRRRWGSCLADGRIILNSELLAAPRECIAYVVGHELCHLREANHGPRFYALMSALVPEWKALRRRLNEEAPLGFLEPPGRGGVEGAGR
ncbi:MAG: M48 family metallopeptidase [Alkalispirochaetaceae bacterium]